MTETLLAPAKINLCLHVLGKRSDGYHELAMLMQRVSLYDRVHIHVDSGDEVLVRCDGLVLPDGVLNIAERAARLLLARSGQKRRIEICIEKNIPSAAGLGGGSSDAATVLLGLNRMLGLGLSREELIFEGLKLGADVPFFVFEHAAWARGVGEQLERAEKLPHFHYVLVNPGVEIATKNIFENLRLTSLERPVNLPAFDTTREGLIAGLHNDLEPPAIEVCSVVSDVKSALCSTRPAGVLMSGSGATVFALYDDHDSALSSRDLMRTRGWWSEVVEPV